MDQVQKQEQSQKHVHIVNGTGQLNIEQNTPFGRIVNRRVCHHCHGTGN